MNHTRKPFFIFLTFIFLSGIKITFSQGHPIFQEKTIGIYLSKKHYSYSDDHLLPMTQFVKSVRGTEVLVDDIKLESLICVGELLSAELAKVTGADSTYFLNQYPTQARSFIKNFDEENDQLKSGITSRGNTDFILVISELEIRPFYTTSVFTRSNRLVTEKVLQNKASLKVGLYPAMGGSSIKSFRICFDEVLDHQESLDFKFHNKKRSRMGTFFARLFTFGFRQIAKDNPDSCPD